MGESFFGTLFEVMVFNTLAKSSLKNLQDSYKYKESTEKAKYEQCLKTWNTALSTKLIFACTQNSDALSALAVQELQQQKALKQIAAKNSEKHKKTLPLKCAW